MVNGTQFQGLLGLLSAEEQEALIDADLSPFVRLRKATRELIKDIREKPQFSLAFQTLNREQMGDDEYKFEAIYEQALSRRVGFTFNGAFNYVDKKTIGGDTRGGTAAAQFQFQLTPENSLVSKSPLMLYLAGDGKWMSGAAPIYNAQAKVKLPITDGIDIPFSLTYASRTEMSNESDVKAQVSFTVDSAKLFRAFRFKTPATQ